jgi:predicted flap endonuclease-1-like 5' DNA nuclease
MKRLFRLTGLLAGLGAALWLMRDRLISLALPREPEPPAFRMAPSEPDDLTEIKGIGTVFAGRLEGMGITTFRDLVAANPETVARHIDTQPTRVQEWVTQARLRLS